MRANYIGSSRHSNSRCCVRGSTPVRDTPIYVNVKPLLMVYNLAAALIAQTHL